MNKLLYFVYDILSTIFFILFYPFVAIFRLHTGKDTGTRLIKMGKFPTPELKNTVIMFHAVSVGEVLSLEKLLNKVHKVYPEYSIVLTTGTKTGQELAHKKYSEILDYITYFPFDIPYAVNNFLDKINPNMVIIAETELWPDFAIQCKRRDIPLVIINGRISDKSFSSYKLLRLFFKFILNLYTKIYTQSELDNKRFIYLGNKPENTEVMANLKFDIERVDSDIDIKKGNSQLFIAGSTHSGENEIIIHTYSKLKETHTDLRMILAPRHMERIPQIENILKDYNFRTGYRSKGDNFDDKDIIILDTFGELKKCYEISDIAFIGGSFNNTGGHNPLEAAIYNVPTITGSNIKNFRDIYAILTEENASVIVKTEEELYKTLNKLLSDKSELDKMVKNCVNVFERQKGAIDFVIDKIEKIHK